MPAQGKPCAGAFTRITERTSSMKPLRSRRRDLLYLSAVAAWSAVTILAGAASASAAPLAPKQPPSSWSTLRKFSTFDFCCQQPAVQFKRLGREASSGAHTACFRLPTTPAASVPTPTAPRLRSSAASMCRWTSTGMAPARAAVSAIRRFSVRRTARAQCPAQSNITTALRSFAQMGHADWVVYTCDPAGKLTHQPAWLGGGGASLDLTNEAVRQWQWAHMDEAASAHFDAIAVDDVILDNPGSRCGVWRCDQPGTCSAEEAIHPTFLFSGKSNPGMDPLWSDAVLHWLSATAEHIHTVPTAAGDHVLGLVANLYEPFAPFKGSARTTTRSINSTSAPTSFPKDRRPAGSGVTSRPSRATRRSNSRSLPF
jgi:hypothetical protein